jgi:hypothetical protein
VWIKVYSGYGWGFRGGFFWVMARHLLLAPPPPMPNFLHVLHTLVNTSPPAQLSEQRYFLFWLRLLPLAVKAGALEGIHTPEWI